MAHVNSLRSHLSTSDTCSQKETTDGMSTTTEKQSSTDVSGMLSLHTSLKLEAEKIRKWKIQMEVEMNQKDRSLQQAEQTMTILRKSVLDLQLQNEATSAHLQQEIEKRDELLQRIESTREMCNLLKTFAATVKERVDQCEAEKEELMKFKNDNIHQFEDLSSRFRNLELVSRQQKQQFEQERSAQSAELSTALFQLEQQQAECNDKENVISQLRQQLTDNSAKLECLQQEYGQTVTSMESNLTLAKEEMEKVGCCLQEALGKEASMTEELEQLEHRMMSKSRELSEGLAMIEQLAAQKSEMSDSLSACREAYEQLSHEKNDLLSELDASRNECTTVVSQLDALNEKCKLLKEEKAELSDQVAQLQEAKSNIEAEKTAVEEDRAMQLLLNKAEIDELTKTCDEKASELGRLKEELEKCENQRLDLSEQLGILSADKNVTETDLKTSRTEAARHKKELEKLTANHHDMEALNVSLRDEIKKLMTKAEKEQAEKVKVQEELQQHLAEARADLQRLLQDVDKRDYQIETFKAQQEEGQKREENLRRQLDKLTYDKNSLQADLSCSRDELDETRQNIQDLSEELKSLERSSSEQIATLTEKLKTEQAERRQAEEKYAFQLEQYKEQVEKLNEQSKHLQLGKESAEKQIKAMSSQMMTSLENYRQGFDDVLERNKAQFEESKKKFEDEIKQLRKETDELQNQLDTAKREKADAELKMIQRDSVIDSSKWQLESELARKDAEMKEMQVHFKKLEAKQNQLIGSFQLEMEECKRACHDTVAGKDAELKDMQMKISSLEDLLERQKSPSSMRNTLRQTDKCSKSPNKKLVEKDASKATPQSGSVVQQSPISPSSAVVTPKRGGILVQSSSDPASQSARKRKRVVFNTVDMFEDDVNFPASLSDATAPETTSGTGLQKEGKMFFKTTRDKAQLPDKQCPLFPHNSGKVILKTSKAAGGGRSKEPATTWMDDVNDVFSFISED